MSWLALAEQIEPNRDDENLLHHELKKVPRDVILSLTEYSKLKLWKGLWSFFLKFSLQS